MTSKEFLVCVDSDGCVMDGMTIKHIKCFYPCIEEVWNLPEKSDEFLNMWSKINLFSQNRGINRFKGLEMFLNLLKQKNVIWDDLKALTKWVTKTKALSNSSLENEIKMYPDECLEKALLWSKRVNQEIEKMPEGSIVPFDWSGTALFEASKNADIAIVSSANKEAVYSEWSKYGLLQHTKFIMTQDDGTKSECIKQLINTGYSKDKVIMIGDAPGDLAAAMNNEVMFYPILAGKEELSWEKFVKIYLTSYFKAEYKDKHMDKCIVEFNENLKG